MESQYIATNLLSVANAINESILGPDVLHAGAELHSVLPVQSVVCEGWLMSGTLIEEEVLCGTISDPTRLWCVSAPLVV